MATQGGVVDMPKGSWEAAILMKIMFCTNSLVEEACCGLPQQSAHRWIDSRAEHDELGMAGHSQWHRFTQGTWHLRFIQCMFQQNLSFQIRADK